MREIEREGKSVCVCVCINRVYIFRCRVTHFRITWAGINCYKLLNKTEVHNYYSRINYEHSRK